MISAYAGFGLPHHFSPLKSHIPLRSKCIIIPAMAGFSTLIDFQLVITEHSSRKIVKCKATSARPLDKFLKMLLRQTKVWTIRSSTQDSNAKKSSGKITIAFAIVWIRSQEAVLVANVLDRMLYLCTSLPRFPLNRDAGVRKQSGIELN